MHAITHSYDFVANGSSKYAAGQAHPQMTDDGMWYAD
jgi:hypothetical protein